MVNIYLIKAFSTTSEAFLGLILLYNYRVLERQWGTMKFSSYLVLSVAISTVLNILSLVALKSTGIDSLSPGLHGAILALTYQYYLEIPSSYSIKVLGMKITDHAFCLILASQFSIVSGLSSLIPACNGLLAGILISVFKPLQNFRLPKFLANFCTSMFLPLLKSDPPAQQSRVTMQNEITSHTANRSDSALAQINEEDLVMLQSMGFERSRIVEALQVILIL